MKVIALIALPLLLLGIVAVEMTKDRGEPSSAAAVVSIPSKVPQKTASADENTGHWYYDSSISQMTDELVSLACLPSNNELEFQFPYTGGGRGVLCFKKIGKRLQANLGVIKGQFVCGVEGCKVSVRFDDRPVQSFHMLIPRTYESNVIYFQSAQAFLKAMKHAKRIRIAADFYQDGEQTLEFSPGGLDESTID
jgi:hypothetical protein